MSAPNPNLMKILTREGVLIHTSVRYWRGRKKLTPEDLGLDREKVSERLVCLGHKRLVPREALAGFALIESRTHALVEGNTFPFLGGIARFLPNSRLEAVNERLTNYAEEFEHQQRIFLSNYEQRRQEALTEWRAFAIGMGADPDRLTAAVDEAFPAPARVAQSFGFETRLFQVALPESLKAEGTSFAEQEAVVEARNSVAREASRKLRAETEAFVADCVATLREQTAVLCREMLASLDQTKGGAHQKTLNRLNRFIDRFKALNFAGDAELETQLEEARRQLLSRSAENYRESDRAKGELVEGLRALRYRASEMARSDAREVVERFGQLGHRRFHFAA